MTHERSTAEQLMLEIRRFVPRKSDCYSVVCEFYERCYRIALPRYEFGSLKIETPPDEVWRDWLRIDKNGTKPGDLVLIRLNSGTHVGILLDDEEMLHSSAGCSPPLSVIKLRDIPMGTRIEFVRYIRKC